MDNEVHHLLNRIRRRIRYFILAEATLVVALLAGLLFWLGLAADWFFEPSRGIRVLAWWFVGAAAAWLLYRFAWVRLQRPLSDRSVALMVERAHPELHDRLTTAVSPVPVASSRSFLEYVHRQAMEQSRDYRPAEVVSYRALKSKLIGSLTLMMSIIAFAVWQQGAFAFWMDRLALSENRWPRRVHLMIEGFERDKTGRLVRRIPRFESAELVIRADLSANYEAPSEVQVAYWEQGQAIQRAPFTRLGDATKGRDKAQTYRFIFDELREPLSLEIRGGDDRLTNLHLDVLPRPRIVSLEVEATFPDYLVTSPRRLPATSVITVPTGTTLKVWGRASRPLDRIDGSLTIEDRVPIKLTVDQTDPRKFGCFIPKILGSGELSFLPVDRNGVAAREPYIVSLVAQTDELPLATIGLVGIGTVVTPNARIPVKIQAEDDYAVEQVWIELSLADQPAQKVNVVLPEASSASTTTQVDIDLEVRQSVAQDFAVEPGQRLSLMARAQDAWNLTDEPRFGTSRIVTLDIVTADQLMESLEREEINLRKTFERIIEKTIQGRDQLRRIMTSESELNEEQLGDVSIGLARVVDDVHQVTDESLAVASGFQLIYDQLVNNRIGDDELKSRLRERIVQPLRAIGEESLPSVALALETMSRKNRPMPRDVAALSGSMQEAIDQMELVLKQMKALETYGEVVAMLRTLIQEQQDLADKTQKSQRRQLETLLLED